MHYSGQFPDALAELETWKRYLIDFLKDSPSRDRKFFRWNVAQLTEKSSGIRRAWKVLEAGELEALSGPSP